jgi:hypothetical protein
MRGQLQAPAISLEEKGPGTHCIGGRVSPSLSRHCAGDKSFLPLPGVKPRFLGCPLRSPSLHRLSYTAWASHAFYIRSVIVVTRAREVNRNRVKTFTAVHICLLIFMHFPSHYIQLDLKNYSIDLNCRINKNRIVRNLPNPLQC